MSRSFPLTIICLLAVLLSCGGPDTDEEHRARERVEMEEKLSGNKVSLYKGIKVCLRSMPVTAGMDTLDVEGLSDETAEEVQALQQVQAFAISLFTRLLQLDQQQEPMTATEYVALATELASLKENLKKLDEDDYPTLLAIIEYALAGTGKYNGSMVESLGWNNGWEHMALYLLEEGSHTLPSEFALYEISKIKPEEMPATELRTCTRLLQSLAFVQNEWPYIAEQQADLGVQEIDRGDIVYAGEPLELLSGTKLEGAEAAQAEWHATSVLTRALARFSMEDEAKHELAFDDLELFMEDAEQLGADNELVWMVGSVLYIKREENEKALENLRKLEASPAMGKDETQVITEIIGYLEGREPDKALNKVTDKVFMGRIVIRYSFKQFKKTEWYERNSQSRAAQTFLKFPTFMDEEWQKAKSYLNVKDKVKNLFKKGEES